MREEFALDICCIAAGSTGNQSHHTALCMWADHSRMTWDGLAQVEVRVGALFLQFMKVSDDCWFSKVEGVCNISKSFSFLPQNKDASFFGRGAFHHQRGDV